MSEIRVNNITNRDGSTGTTVAGIPVVDSNSHFVVPTGRTGSRYVYTDGGENIVRDGLVLHLDAKYSYPSKTGITSTTDSLDPDVYTWYDMSGYNNHASLESISSASAGPSYNTANGGYFEFTSFDRVSFGTQEYDSSLPLTFSTWVNIADLSVATTIPLLALKTTKGEYLYILASESSNYEGITIGGPSNWVRRNTDTANTFFDGNWVNITVTYNGESTSDANNFKIYENSVSKTLNDDTGGLATTGDAGTNNLNQFGRFNSGNTASGTKYAQVMLYQKELTAAEVLQNYNALKGRFGL